MALKMDRNSKILVVALLVLGVIYVESRPDELTTDEWIAACSDDAREDTSGTCQALFQSVMMEFKAAHPVGISKDLCGNAGRAYGNLGYDRPVGAQRFAAYSCLYAYGSAVKACGWGTSLSDALMGVAGDGNAAQDLMEFMAGGVDEAACAAETMAYFNRHHRLYGELPEGAAALSLGGEALVAAEAPALMLTLLAEAEADYDATPDVAENVIWYGRRLAYLGRYTDAIDIFTKGMAAFPTDARFYRHRGHRYISMREFDRAILDFEIAAALIAGSEDAIEPDGLPNAAGIPLTTTHGNIWYHLGLAYYLVGDMENALRGFTNDFETSQNDDNIAATAYWRTMILRRLGRGEEAIEVLDGITPDMNIIENDAYYRLALLFKGDLNIDDMTGAGADDPSNAALAYGVANWYALNGDGEKAEALLEAILSGSSWASFGYIAAEADLAAR